MAASFEYVGCQRGVLARIFALTLLVCSAGCGLVLDSEDRLNRGEEALDSGNYRAAIIDAKEVLLDEPNNQRGRLVLGRALVRSGDAVGAEKELRRAVELGSDPLVVAADLGRALVAQGKYQEAIDEIDVVNSMSEDDVAAIRLLRGDAFLGARQPVAARESYIAALEIVPDSLDARVGIINCHIAENNLVQARAEIDQALSEHAADARIWLYSGAFNNTYGNFAGGRDNYQVALDLASEQSDVALQHQSLAGLAESHIELQDTDAARPLVKQLVSEAPNALQTLFLTSKIAYLDEDWPAAQRQLQRLLQIAPNFRPAQVLLGAVNLRSGNLAQAEMYLSSAVASAPDDVQARRLLAETQIQLQKSAEAMNSLAPLIAGPDADFISLHMAARASSANADPGETIRFLRKSIEKDPQNVDAKLQLAAILIQSAKSGEAAEVLDTIDAGQTDDIGYQRGALGILLLLQRGDQNEAVTQAGVLAEQFSQRADAQNLHGALLLADNNLVAARASFGRALKIDPANELAHRYLGHVDELSGDLDAAASHYKNVLATNANANWANTALGRIAQSQGDAATAAAHFKIVLDAVPNDVVARFNLANAEQARGNAQVALSLLEEGGDASRDHFASALLKGAIMADSGDADAAMAVTERLLEEHPDNAQTHAFAGEVYLLKKDLVRADAAYDTARTLGNEKRHAMRSYWIKLQLDATLASQPLLGYLETNPDASDVRLALAEYYMQQNDVRESVAAYESVATELPDNEVLLNNLAWGYFLVDDPRAVDTARRAYELSPENAAIIDTYGWILTQRGEVEKGEQLLRKAVKISNGRAEIKYHHAAALAELGREDEARIMLQEILNGDSVFSSRSDAEKLAAEL
ncbi:MAG: tetratricopeptide repeat protein [Pseudomonadota bacterium]